MDVILDVDTGVDDALALLLALRAPDVNVRAVTCVDGNVDVDNVVTNTLAVLDAAGAPEIPVARGCPQPLAAERIHAQEVHGCDGLGGVRLPASGREPVEAHAVEVLRRTLLDSGEPLTVVTLAPLTNVAVLLTCYPELAERIDRMVVMGGSAGFGGNDSVAAEFNLLHDPEAADIVFRSGVPITMYGLDAFYEVTVDTETAHGLSGSTDPAGALAGSLLLAQARRFAAREVTIGDAGAVAAAVWPEHIDTDPHHVRVELHGAHTRGSTVVDQRARRGILAGRPSGSHNARVVWSVDDSAVREKFLAAVSRHVQPFSTVA